MALGTAGKKVDRGVWIKMASLCISISPVATSKNGFTLLVATGGKWALLCCGNVCTMHVLVYICLDGKQEERGREGGKKREGNGSSEYIKRDVFEKKRGFLLSLPFLHSTSSPDDSSSPIFLSESFRLRGVGKASSSSSSTRTSI